MASNEPNANTKIIILIYNVSTILVIYNTQNNRRLGTGCPHWSLHLWKWSFIWCNDIPLPCKDIRRQLAAFAFHLLGSTSLKVRIYAIWSRNYRIHLTIKLQKVNMKSSRLSLIARFKVSLQIHLFFGKCAYFQDLKH